MGQADHLIVDSEHTKRDVMHLYGIAEGKLTVVYPSSPQHQPVRDPERIADTKRRLGIDGPYLLYVGRIELRKNVSGLVRAFQLLKTRGVFDGLPVLAGPRDADACDPAGSPPPPGRRDDVLVTGLVDEDDLPALYSGALAFCFPSFYEGFGLPVLEALSCGAPVLTPPVSSLPEVAADAALYANPYEVEEIASALERIIHDGALREELIEKGYRQAAQFDGAEAARRAIAVYERAASA